MPLFPQICSLPPTPVFLQYSLWKPDPTWLLSVDRAHACLTVMTQSRLETKRRGNDGFLWRTGKGGGWQLQIRVSPITCSTEIKLSVRLSPSRFNWFYTFLLWWFSGLNNAVCSRLSHLISAGHGLATKAEVKQHIRLYSVDQRLVVCMPMTCFLVKQHFSFL